MDSHTTSDQRNGLEIAIIGLVGRFPGAKNIDEFWRAIQGGVESISFFSDEELETAGLEPCLVNTRHHIKAGGVLDAIELFDAAFFGFTPREAEIMDPQHRLFLECAWQALESAGYDPGAFAGSIGIYGGMSMSKYLLHNLLPNRDLAESVGSLQMRIFNDKDFLASLAAYKLDLKGPSVTVQTACSTSLVAVCLACQSLLNYQCDVALAGGVSIAVPQKSGYPYQEGGIFSPDGHCRAFDAKAQGSVEGSGVGLVVLKRLADAVADGDTIHAVIKGAAINNDGALKLSYTAPSVDGQAEVIAMAQAMAGVEPDTIGYVETHGTGTALGDPIEIAALTQVFRASTDRKGFCAIGSVKTNIGHLDAAAGIAGLIKTVLALKHKLVPPSLHFETPNPHIDFTNSPFYVSTALSEWKADKHPRRAGVSSFSVGGVNAHVIVEEAPGIQSSGPSRPWQLLPLSAKTPAALEVATDNLVHYLQQRPDQDLADVAYTLQTGRRAFDYRRTVVCRSVDDAAAALQARDPLRVLSSVQGTGDRPIAFMFSGLGNHYVDMALGLYQAEPVFREHIDRCSELLKADLDLDLREVLYPSGTRPAGASQGGHSTSIASPTGLDLRKMLYPDAPADDTTQHMMRTSLAQPALFMVEYGLAQLWMHWGVRPQALIGYSLGEYVAACLAGVFSLENALHLVAQRAQLIQALPNGAMLAVPLSEQQVYPLLGQSLCLAAINGPCLCVVSGPTEAVVALERRLTERGTTCRRLPTSHAFHSKMMEPIVAPFGKLLKSIEMKAPNIPYISNVTGTWITPAQATQADYWSRHLCQAVRFADGVMELWRQPGRILLELGPGQALTSSALQHPAGEKMPERVALPSLRQSYDRRPDVEFLLSTLAKLWLAGIRMDWPAFNGTGRRQRLPLPTYPFERQYYWVEPPRQTSQVSTSQDATREPSPVEASRRASAFSLHPRPNVRNAYVAPTDERERAIVQIWQRLLGIEPIGIHDNFFELGGNSLLATQLILQLRDAFQVELPVRGLLETPTVARFAQTLDVACRHGSAETLPATAAIDLSAEASLDPAIRPETAFIDPVPEPAHIFLTGATGFLGASLLHELLQQTQADIHCLVRAADVEEGQKRLQRNLASYSLWDERLSSRIIPVIGELAQPLLGLSSEQFRMLAGKLDVIYHNGALVNFIYPYQELKETNVLGTQEILRLASQVKVKPVHYVSSIAVFDSAAYARAEIVREEDPLPYTEGFYTGYAQTKWVADRLTMEARSRGIPLCIYRPGNVAGSSQTGICNTTDYLFRMIKGCIQLGIAPADEMLVDITPVDYVSKALVYLSRQKESLGKVFHLVNPYPGYWSNLLDWIVSAGYPLQRIPYLQWRAKLLNLVEGSQDNALYPLVAFLPEEQAASPEVPSQSRMLRYDCRNTLAGLAGTSITCPPIDAALLSTYFAYLVRSGFLDAPPMSR